MTRCLLIASAGLLLLAGGCKKGEAPPVPSDVAAPPADATVTKSGLAFKVLQKGTGTAKPTRTSKVKVH